MLTSLNIKFIDSEYQNSKLSLHKLNNTTHRDIRFRECKATGLHFEDCNPLIKTFATYPDS